MTRSKAVGPTVALLIAAVGFAGCSGRTQSTNADGADPDDTVLTPEESGRIDSPDDQLKPSPTGPDADVGNDSEERTDISKRDAGLDDAIQLSEQGRLDEAADVLRRLLLADPQDAEVIFRLANVFTAEGSLAEAVELLESIPADHPEAGIPALGQSADLSMRLERYDRAEQLYLEILRRVPQAYPARRQLAFLLNRQGRRHEAAEHIRELCRIGNVRQDELHSLIMLSHAMYDDPSQKHEPSQEHDAEVLYSPIGPGGIARKLFTDGKFSEAADALQSSVEQGDAPPALVALYGRAAVEAQDDQRFLWWLARVDDEVRQMSDYWAAVGTYLISQRRFEEATRALLEAAQRDPTDMNSFGRLGQTLLTLGDRDASQQWLDRWDDMNELVKANNRVSETTPPDPTRVFELSERLLELHRPLESVLWRSIESHYRGQNADALSGLNQQMREIVGSGGSFANETQRLCGMDLDAYPLPTLKDMVGFSAEPVRPSPTAKASITPASLENVADRIGVRHAYQVAAQPQTEGFAIYQAFGGGVAVADFDCDGWPDLYFAQGGSDPPSFRGISQDQPLQTNQLYRCLAAAAPETLNGDSPKRESQKPDTGRSETAGAHDVSMIDVGALSGAADDRYSIGVTAGDWNQDGFPDFVVANIGDDALLINNGDGTFTEWPLIVPEDANRVPMSVAMADLDGDTLPDIFELSYVDDPTMIYLPTRDENRDVIKAMSPMQYKPGSDRICINDGEGGMSIRRFNTDPTDYRTGLGLVITDFNGRPGNEVFVGNDLYPDQLWVFDSDRGNWSDVAPAVGCAFGIRGSKTASMGIGVGDVDANGAIDIHITNYQNRNASLFLNQGDAFLERNVQFGLADASQAVLGFGTQMIDYDNDGRLDMVATNGHIEKAITIDEPFEQPAQLFANLGGRFQVIDASDRSGYWQRKHLGRGLARVDLNRDGRSDFVITHLGEPSAVILNRTETSNHWLQCRLIGVQCEREAIGARVTLSFGDQTRTSWVTAGDGYLCKNESVLSFGLGTHEGPVQLTVDWPDGSSEVFREVTPDQRITIVQGDSSQQEDSSEQGDSNEQKDSNKQGDSSE